MTLHAPQIIVLSIFVLSLGFDLAKHGESKTGEHNFGTSLIATILMLALLYWGGFFA